MVGVDNCFCWASGDRMEVGVGMGAHDDDKYGFVGLRWILFGVGEVDSSLRREGFLLIYIQMLCHY